MINIHSAVVPIMSLRPRRKPCSYQPIMLYIKNYVNAISLLPVDKISAVVLQGVRTFAPPDTCTPVIFCCR